MQQIRSLAVNNKIIKSRVNLYLSPFLKDIQIKKLSTNVSIIEKRRPEFIKNKFDSYYKETKEQEMKEKQKKREQEIKDLRLRISLLDNLILDCLTPILLDGKLTDNYFKKYNIKLDKIKDNECYLILQKEISSYMATTNHYAVRNNYYDHYDYSSYEDSSPVFKTKITLNVSSDRRIDNEQTCEVYYKYKLINDSCYYSKLSNELVKIYIRCKFT
jgi:hypothetical protein